MQCELENMGNNSPTPNFAISRSASRNGLFDNIRTKSLTILKDIPILWPFLDKFGEFEEAPIKDFLLNLYNLNLGNVMV
jgi:hypothetical protein